MRLRLFRVAAGLNQRQLATKLGVTSNFISMIERGHREPTFRFLRSFAKTVRVPISVLLWEPEDSGGRSREEHDVNIRIASLFEEYARLSGAKRGQKRVK